LMMYYAAAVGLDCSTRSSGSWRAMVQALLESAGGGLLQAVLFGFLGGAVGALAGFLVGLESLGFALGTLAVLGVTLLVEAETRLEQASLWVAQNERVPQGGERFTKPVGGDKP
ncbi:MAG: hypothetical protein K2W96_08070, partial [Gemmataceae bacterium]|nr:hypothetical protein [Gemmataceae bacterium]